MIMCLIPCITSAATSLTPSTDYGILRSTDRDDVLFVHPGDNLQNIYVNYKAKVTPSASKRYTIIATPGLYTGNLTLDTDYIDFTELTKGTCTFTGTITSTASDAKALTTHSYNADLYVAASNASAWEKNQADYVCDGTDDDLVINAAIQAMPQQFTVRTGSYSGGGTIRFSAGTFAISDSIIIDRPIEFTGAGQDSTAFLMTTGANCPTIIVSNGTYRYSLPRLSYFNIQGAATTQTDHTVYAIKTLPGACADMNIDHVWINDCVGGGIELNTCWNMIVSECAIESCQGPGIHITSTARASGTNAAIDGSPAATKTINLSADSPDLSSVVTGADGDWICIGKKGLATAGSLTNFFKINTVNDETDIVTISTDLIIDVAAGDWEIVPEDSPSNFVITKNYILMDDKNGAQPAIRFDGLHPIRNGRIYENYIHSTYTSVDNAIEFKGNAWGIRIHDNTFFSWYRAVYVDTAAYDTPGEVGLDNCMIYNNDHDGAMLFNGNSTRQVQNTHIFGNNVKATLTANDLTGVVAIGSGRNCTVNNNTISLNAGSTKNFTSPISISSSTGCSALNNKVIGLLAGAPLIAATSAVDGVYRGNIAIDSNNDVVVDNRTSDGSPSGVLTPMFVGEDVLDTTNSKWYKAVGLANTNWAALN